MGNTARKLAPETVALQAVPVLTETQSRSIISPTADIAMIGGASLVFFFLANMFLGSQAPGSDTGWFIFNLSFIANFPHFLSSYHMLYGDFRKRIFTQARYFWAGVVVPLIIVGVIAYAFASGSVTGLAALTNAMFFFVGWHYVKQTFGGMVVSNALNKIYYDKTERWAIKANLFSIWFISWVFSNLSGANYDYEGVPYSVFQLPPIWGPVALALVICTGIVAVAIHVRKYLRTGQAITSPALACWGALIAWYLPSLYHPTFFQMVPLFHSLQYLLFVTAFRKNKAKAQAGDLGSPQGRKKFLFGFYGNLIAAVITGGTFMWYLPKFIDGHWPNALVPTAAMFSLTVFINVHHYFIDNVLWRSDNDEMRAYLFSK